MRVFRFFHALLSCVFSCVFLVSTVVLSCLVSFRVLSLSCACLFFLFFDAPQAAFLKKELLHAMEAIDELFQANQVSSTIETKVNI